MIQRFNDYMPHTCQSSSIVICRIEFLVIEFLVMNAMHKLHTYLLGSIIWLTIANQQRKNECDTLTHKRVP